MLGLILRSLHIFFWIGVDLSKHLHCKQMHSKICPAIFQLCFSEEVRLSLFVPKTVRVFCQNIFMTYFSCVSITNCCHRQYEEFWCEHFTSEHFAFSSHLFVARLVCKGLYWLTPSDLAGGSNDYHFFIRWAFIFQTTMSGWFSQLKDFSTHHHRGRETWCLPFSCSAH